MRDVSTPTKLKELSSPTRRGLSVFGPVDVNTGLGPKFSWFREVIRKR